MEKDKKNFQLECMHAVEVSRQTLQTILEDNKDTEYGKRYGFSEILASENLEGFRKLPLTEYEDYKDDIERMMQGEEGIVTAYPVKFFLTSSGSSRQKYIPMTDIGLTKGYDIIYCVALPDEPEWEACRHLHTSVMRVDETDKVTILSCADFQTRREKTYGFFDKFIGGEDFIFSKEIGDAWYVKLWLALSEPKLKSIYSIYLYDILLLFQYFKDHWEEVLYDMEHHNIPSKIDISKDIREKLLAIPLPEQDWFDFVRSECEKGFEGIGKRIWKECCLVNGIGGQVFGTQEQVLRGFLGDIPLHYYLYASSEAHIGIAIKEEMDSYVCIPHSCFMEFIPYDGDEDDIKWMGELELGKKYEIVITNFCGFYRYRMLDVVEVVDFYGHAPVIRFAFRRNMAVNIAGEKTNLSMIADVVSDTAAYFGETILEYSVCVDETVMPNRYCFFLEGDYEHNDAEYAKVLEEELCKKNFDYKDLKELGDIAAPICIHVENKTHAAWKTKKGMGGHNKPLQFSTDKGFMEFMKERKLIHGAER